MGLIMFSRREVEEVYGLSARFLELAAAKANGPAVVRFGRTVRYRACDVEEWILAHREAT